MQRTVHPFGGATPTERLDLFIATLVALGLPWIALILLRATGGALTSLIVYYGVGGVLLYRWRLGWLDYDRPQRWPWRWFGFGMLISGLITLRNWGVYPDYGAPGWAIWLTVVIWGGFNAALEQFSWLYVLLAWRNRWPAGRQQRLGMIVGSLLLIILVALIHAIFWVEILPEAQFVGWQVFPGIGLNLLLTLSYVMMYLQARSFWPVFMVHFMVDLQIVVLAGYSIWPSL